MNSPLQLFRDLLPFNPPPPEQRAASKVRVLLEANADSSASEMAVTLFSEVIPVITRQPNLNMRFKLLEETRHEAERILPVLESQISQSALPLPKKTAQMALDADNLLKALAMAYHGISRDAGKLQNDNTLTPLFHRSIQRAMSAICRRQQLAYRAYASPSAPSWTLLHELYQMACSPSAKPLNGETAPVELQYLSALLLAYVDPNKLPRSEFNAVVETTQQLAAYALIAPYQEDLETTNKEFSFLVRPKEGCPGLPLRRLPDKPTALGALLIDCQPVVAVIDRNLSRCTGKSSHPDLEIPPAVLQNLRIALGGKGTRRFSRTRFRPRGDLVGGLDSVMEFIDGNAFTRRAVDAECRNAARFSPSEWSLVDESPDGFRVRFIKGDKWKAGAGDIVALQPRESSRIHVCLVRRIANGGSRLELGLQMLSPQVSVVEISSEGSMAQRAIFLHSLPAYGKFSGLVSHAGQLASGQEIELKWTGRTLRRQIGQCIEANEGLEFFALDPLPN
ncbi:MAG: hypothetical protein D3M94_12235 [Rhodocyclales bacterium GT-UBC]|nr:MAG: hypothetical protein D3M94_12235 [Rhodocyclales bacterium GT-UBC]